MNVSKEEKVKWILENCINEYGDIDLSGLNLRVSEKEGVHTNVYINDMQVFGYLWQNNQIVDGDLYQNGQQVRLDLHQEGNVVGEDLHQGCQNVGRHLIQKNQHVSGDLQQFFQRVDGKISQDTLAIHEIELEERIRHLEKENMKNVNLKSELNTAKYYASKEFKEKWQIKNKYRELLEAIKNNKKIIVDESGNDFEIID